jgi:uncharacterized membrane protein YhaH (DUF805 family)
LAVKDFWARFFDFTGKTPLKPFWQSILFVAGTLVMALAADVFLVASDRAFSVPPLPALVVTSVWGLLVSVPTIAMVWRRLIDSGRSGWWSLGPLSTTVVTLLLTEDTSGDSWVPIVTVFLAMLTISLILVVLFFLSRPTRYVRQPFAAPLGATLALAVVLSVGAYPAVTNDGVVDYSRVSNILGLGPLWERTFPDGCGAFLGMITDFDTWQEPVATGLDWGRAELFSRSTPTDRLACIQSHSTRETTRGFLYQRADEHDWLVVRENLLASGFSDLEVWGWRGLGKLVNHPGDPGWSETEIVFYGDAGSLLYTWTDDNLWLRDSFRQLLDYVGNFTELSTAGLGDDVPRWTIGDIEELTCSSFDETLAQRTEFTELVAIRDDEWRNRGAPILEDEPGEYLLCLHRAPSDFHSGREFRIQSSVEIDSQYRALLDQGFEEIQLGEFWGLFREQSFEQTEESYASWVDEVYLFADDGWVYFGTIDGILYVNDPYLDIPRQVISQKSER